MIRRIFWILAVGLILFWGVFAFISIISFSKDASYLTYFGNQDGKIIAIHHPNDFDLQDIQVDANQKNLAIMATLKNELTDLKTAFLSKNRSLIVLQLHEKWSFVRIRQLFEKGIYSFERTGANTFNFGKYRGEFKSKELLLYDYSIELVAGELPQFELDEQCSYSIMDITQPTWVIDNYYVKDFGTISYRNTPASKNRGTLVNDAELFGPYLPEKSTHYEFYEKNYLIETDTIFARSSLRNIMKTGGVLIVFNEHPIFIFDMEASEELSMILNEFYHIQEENKDRTRIKRLPVCKEFQQLVPGGNVTAYSRDGVGYITSDENALDALLLEIDMRKTSASKALSKALDESLPRWCSYRKISASNLSSISWINHQMFMTRIVLNASNQATESSENVKNYFTMNPGSPILSYCALAGRGNVVIETDQELIGYKNGSLKWRKKHATTLAFRPLRLMTSLQENDHILLYENNRIQVIDRMGRDLFTISGSFYGQPIQTVLNQENVVGLSKTNELCFYTTENGKLLKRISFNEKIEQWQGIQLKGKYGVGVKTEDQVLFIELSSGKKHRFTGKPEDFIGFISEGAIFRGKKGMEIHVLSNMTEVQVPSYWKFGGELTVNGQSGTLFYDTKTLVYAVKGKIRWKTSSDLAEINEVHVGQNLIIVRDGLQNKILLMNVNGGVIDQEERPSQGEIQTTPFGNNGCSLTTLLNGFLIQYNF